MRLTLKVWQIVGSILILGACNKAAPLNRESRDIQHSVDVPSTEAKSDRPTETGEGLPGYLIDPAKLVIESNAGVWTVTGAPAAVRNLQGDAASVNIWLVKLAKNTVKLRKQNQDWQMDGTKLASVQTDGQGTFRIQGALGSEDLLFVKVEDAAGAQIRYKAAAVNSATLWIDGNAAKIIDSTVAGQIESQVAAAQPNSGKTLAQLIEQVRTTGQCRNCNLGGADLSGFEIVDCDLSFSNLMGAKFVLSNIANCNFTNSNLSQVDFTQANMASANLTQADITGAVFTGANVEGVMGQQIPMN